MSVAFFLLFYFENVYYKTCICKQNDVYLHDYARTSLEVCFSLFKLVDALDALFRKCTLLLLLILSKRVQV
jgi:hypothetical protein